MQQGQSGHSIFLPKHCLLWRTKILGLKVYGTPLVLRLSSLGVNNAGGQLAFRDTAGVQKVLSFATLPSKCAFGAPIAASGTANPSAPIYCAVPSDQNIFSVARLPDEYNQDMYFTDDDFYSIDTDTGLLNEIFSASLINQTIDATDMKVFNNILFFVNRYDQKIYALALQ